VTATCSIFRLWLLGIAALTLALLAACPAPQHTSPPPQGMRIFCSHADATVYVNELLVGRCIELRKAWIGLPIGRHRVLVQLTGHFSRYFDVTLKKGEIRHLDVRLEPELD
jgi:hypothetical protein